MEEDLITQAKETGVVVKAKDYLLTLEGFPSAHVGDVIINARKQRALITALQEDGVEAELLDPGGAHAGERFVTYEEGIRLHLSDALLGRVVNVFGAPVDQKDPLPEPNTPIETDAKAAGMSERAAMTKQLPLGMPAVDVLLPIAKGQRQLIIGPLGSGKNVFLESAIAHQRDANVVCVYALIGRPRSYIEDVVSSVLGPNGNPNAIIVVTRSDEPAPLIALTPPVATQIAEHFSKQGKDVLLVLDDLGTHAKYYREIALLAGRVPGRESYPGDMFYEQAHLMERAGYFNEVYGSGSITLFPVLETNIEDMSGLISTNIMSATDGHLFFSPLAHAEGLFPAVEPERSVTRVGRQTQTTLAKQLSLKVQALLADYDRQQRFSQFGAQLSPEAQETLSRGSAARVFIRQEPMQAIQMPTQIILLSLVFTPLFAKCDEAYVRKNYAALREVIWKESRLEPIVQSAQRGTISFEQFVKKLSGVQDVFSAVCQQA